MNALLKAGADPKVLNQHQNTVLHYAANCQAKEKTCVEIAKLILKAGVDVNVQDNDGDTALIIAAQNHHPLLKKLFLDAGADPRLKNKESKSAESYE